MAVKRPWREGLRPVAGSIRLMGLRWLLFVVAALPGLASAVNGVGARIGNRPYFAEAPDPLPFFPLVRLLDHLPGAIWGTLALAVVTAWLGHQLLTAGAVWLFGRPPGSGPGAGRAVSTAGTRYLWVYLRIALVALALAALGAGILGALGGRLVEHGNRAMWTLRTLVLLGALRVLATLCWLTLVGLFAWWCRVIVVADERRRVRRVLTIVPRLWRRRPWGALVTHFLLALASLLAGAALLFAWRQSPAGPAGWVVAWLAVLAGLSFLWHWRLRAGRLLWSSPELIDLRAVPDVPWRLPSRLLARLKRRPAGARRRSAQQR